MPEARTVGLIIATFFLPPVAVLISTNELGTDFWINLILTLLAWIPGVIHALWVIFRSDDRRGHNYDMLPPTLPK